MNGIELLEQVKSLNPYTMVIFLTPYRKIDVAMEVIQLGADNFVVR